MKNYLLIVLGLIVATIGFAFAFSGSKPEYFSYYGYTWLEAFLIAYPNLLSEIVIGIGGIAIAITGELYRRRLDKKEA